MKVFFGIAAVSVCLYASPILAMGPVDKSSVVKALLEYICYDAYWQDKPYYRFGDTADIDFVIRGQAVFVRGRHLFSGPYAGMQAYFVGSVKNGLIVIWKEESYNPSVMQGNAYYMENEKIYSDAHTSQQTQVTLPQPCEQKFESNSDVKSLMLKTIKQTFRNQFVNKNDGSSSKASAAQGSILVADFNPDYPATYAYLPVSDDVYQIELHDVADYFSEKYEATGRYPVSLLGKSAEFKTLIEKIKQHPIDLP